MSIFRHWISRCLRGLMLGTLATVLSWSLGVYGGLAAPAQSPDTPTQYVAADGRDLTVVVECLPKQLSQPSLARALRESGNDFLEKVFNLKEDYDNYRLDEAEIDYLACLERNGVTPQVER